MSLICFDCIGDNYLRNANLVQTEIEDCNFCSRKNIHCIRTEDFAELLEPVIHLYSPIEEFMFIEEMKNVGEYGRYIWEALQEDWGLFPELDYSVLENLFMEMYLDPKDLNLFLSSFVEDEYSYYGSYQQKSEELEEKWIDFCEEIKFNNRFFPQKILDIDLIGELLGFLHTTLSINTVVYRARISGSDKKYECSDMKKPPKQISTAGRANPQGIPYLYLASSISTAISEVRPTVAEKISVAEFRAKKSLDIVDLRDPKIDSPFRFEHNLRHFLMHLGFLRILGSEISKPMNPNDAQFEYIPLQYLCEFIKNENYDGVAYISSISDGYNLAIFSDDKLECIETKQYLVNEVNLSYEEM